MARSAEGHGPQRIEPDMFLGSFLAARSGIDNPLIFKVVGLARFELTTSCTPCKRSTKLSYSPRRSEPQQIEDMNEVEADCKPWISGKMRAGGKGLPLTRWRDDGIDGDEVA